jgi:beta-lactamase class A
MVNSRRGFLTGAAAAVGTMKGGSIDVPGYDAVCAPSGMVFDDRWVYLCLTINWHAKAETDVETVKVFAAAAL